MRIKRDRVQKSDIHHSEIKLMQESDSQSSFDS
jgi:hypothetical protein